MIAYKLKYVLLPKMREERGKELRKCINFNVFRGLVGAFAVMRDACTVIN